MEPKTIPAKRIHQTDLWFDRGELSRGVLDARPGWTQPIAPASSASNGKSVVALYTRVSRKLALVQAEAAD